MTTPHLIAGRALRRAGRDPEAHAHRHPALALFTEIGPPSTGHTNAVLSHPAGA